MKVSQKRKSFFLCLASVAITNILHTHYQFFSYLFQKLKTLAEMDATATIAVLTANATLAFAKNARNKLFSVL